MKNVGKRPVKPFWHKQGGTPPFGTYHDGNSEEKNTTKSFFRIT